MPPEKITPQQLEQLQKAEARAHTSDPHEGVYSSPILRLITSSARGPLSRSVVEESFNAGEVIFYEGDQGESMYLVWSGQVVILRGDPDAPVVLAFRKPGEIFGEMALLENQPRSATVIALDNTRLLKINRTGFEQLLQESPHISRSIMGILSARLRRMNEERSSGELSEKRLSRQVKDLQSEKQRLEELQNLRQETTELIIHDLRNPLGAVAVSLKMLSLMLPEDVLQANQEMLNIAQASCDRMQRLVDSLLEVSRMEEGVIPFSMSSVDLKSLISDIVSRVAILARPGTEVMLDLPAEVPPVLVDADKIERVIMNLLDNAFKYSPENSRVEIQVVPKGNFVEVTICDEGPGISAEDRERIFERFAQIPAKDGRRRGFGLGLTYCRLAIERHGGRIWVEARNSGQGSRFVFTLPAAKPEMSE